MHIFISGRPGSGKTTLVLELLPYLDDYTGFITTEVRESGKRIGFKIKDISTGEEDWLAKVGAEGPSVGKYGVMINNLERIALKSLERKAKWTVIDEVGKMEFCSERVKKAILGAFKRENLIAVLHRDFLYLADTDVFWLEKEKFQEVKNKILEIIKNGE